MLEVEDLSKDLKTLSLEVLLKLRDITQDDLVERHKDYLESKAYSAALLKEIEERISPIMIF